MKILFTIINPFTDLMIMVICLLRFTLMPMLACSAETVRVGVLAFRPKMQKLVQWQPLADALKQAIPQYDNVMDAYSYSELERAVTSHQLDFVLTNPEKNYSFPSMATPLIGSLG